jgi:hypothetical protein
LWLLQKKLEHEILVCAAENWTLLLQDLLASHSRVLLNGDPLAVLGWKMIARRQFTPPST